MPVPATNLDELFRACNPDHPLSADDERYVDLAEIRGTRNFAHSVTRSIRRSGREERIKCLFTGHRGSGKSTELLRLQAELQRNGFFVVYMDVEELLDLVEISYLDVLLAIAKRVEEEMRDARLPLPDHLLEAISDWFADKILESDQREELEASLKAQAEAGTQIPFFAKLLATFTSEIKTASSRRTHTRQTLERELPVFIDKLNTLIEAARSKIHEARQEDLVLIVDGLEKMHYTVNNEQVSSHSDFFIHHAEQLKSPACHVVYTRPISLAYNANLGNDYDSPWVLPMVKTSPEGVERLTELVAKRVEIGRVFEAPELLTRLIELSGGVVRDLMRLLRLATDTDAERIGEADVDYAEKTLVREYDRLLRREDLPRLREIHDQRRVQGDELSERLLNLRLVLEYQNGERWAALHPALQHIDWFAKALDDHSGE